MSNKFVDNSEATLACLENIVITDRRVYISAGSKAGSSNLVVKEKTNTIIDIKSISFLQATTISKPKYLEYVALGGILIILAILLAIIPTALFGMLIDKTLSDITNFLSIMLSIFGAVTLVTYLIMWGLSIRSVLIIGTDSDKITVTVKYSGIDAIERLQLIIFSAKDKLLM